MNIYSKFLKKFMALSLTLTLPIFTSGYGYMGNLPKLGDETKPEEQANFEEKIEETQIKPSSIIVPRIAPSYKINKYSNYLSDIKEINTLLKEIKIILENNEDDKIQFFCAKVNLLNLYVDIFKKKYGTTPEQHYESYKQLVVLDKYLKEIVDYKLGIEKEKALSYKSLENRVRNEENLNKKIEHAIIPVNTVLEIIEETG